MMADAIAQTGVELSFLLTDLISEDALMQTEGVLVNGVVDDHRSADVEFLFIAHKGQNSHGLLYANAAVEKGAKAILWDGEYDDSEQIISSLPASVSCISCEDLQQKIGIIASRFYGDPSKAMNVIGVTGTDGKSSITHFIAQCLDSFEGHCGVMGTLGNGLIHDLHPTGLTTADPLQVQKSLSELREAGCNNVAMEVSSHGLHQGRINGVEVDTAVFSNFSQDHLDYHKTIEDYAEAKKRLFFVPGLKVAVINLDDAFGKELAKQCRSHLCVWGFSMLPHTQINYGDYADYMVLAETVEATKAGYHLKVKTPQGQIVFDINLLGQFNVSNILATLSVLLVAGMSIDIASKKLSAIYPVSGRMEIISVAEKPTIVVDYAHTPQGLDAACNAIRDHFSGEMWCVFGCGGDRDKQKRPLMAQVAEKYADHVIVTTDNPRHEKPEEIINEIMVGFEGRSNVESIQDRRMAIAKAIESSGQDDVILIAGKGHEASQIVGDVHIAFDDRLVTRELLGAMS